MSTSYNVRKGSWGIFTFVIVGSDKIKQIKEKRRI